MRLESLEPPVTTDYVYANCRADLLRGVWFLRIHEPHWDAEDFLQQSYLYARSARIWERWEGGAKPWTWALCSLRLLRSNIVGHEKGPKVIIKYTAPLYSEPADTTNTENQYYARMYMKQVASHVREYAQQQVKPQNYRDVWRVMSHEELDYTDIPRLSASNISGIKARITQELITWDTRLG